MLSSQSYRRHHCFLLSFPVTKRQKLQPFIPGQAPYLYIFLMKYVFHHIPANIITPTMGNSESVPSHMNVIRLYRPFQSLPAPKVLEFITGRG